jgi:LysR family nitrogen assimilation transcriptional regulator
MDVRELRYFISVARNRSFTKAAEELFVAQSALSRQIKKLEDELGVQLLTRHAKGVELTRAGVALMERADPLIHMVRQIKAELGASTEPEGHLSIAVPPGAGLQFAGDFLQAFSAAFPKVSIHLLDGASASLQEWLLNRKVDIAVLHNVPPISELNILPLLEEPTLLVCKTGTVLPKLESASAGFSIQDLKDLPLILPASPHHNRILMDRAAAQSSVSLNIAYEVDSVPIIKQLVKKGLGCGIFTQAVVDEEVKAGVIDTYPLRLPITSSLLSIAWRKNESPPAGLNEAVQLLRQTVGGRVAAGLWPGQVRLP